MLGQIIEIVQDGRHLAKSHGFLTISVHGQEIGRVALDRIDAVLASAHGLTYSNNLIVALAERGVPVVLCGSNHMPAAFLWPAESHHEQGGRVADQAAAGLPLKKRLWAQLVRSKIENQGAILHAVGASGGGFGLLARSVRSGDSDNIEAQAARRYWPLLMGECFRRDRDAPGANGLLNYGYAILRSGMARAVMGAGLHPSLGLEHRQRRNSFALVDDLMEPFRPLCDLLVWRLLRAGVQGVDAEAKRALAGILWIDLSTPAGASPVRNCMTRAATSLADCLDGRAKQLDLPMRPLPLEAAP